MNVKAESALKLLSRQKKKRRIHMSKLDSLVFIQQEQYPYDEMRAFRKPKGLWYGINESWVEWCSTESPGWVQDHLHELVLDESKILRVSNLKEFELFEKEFGMMDPMLKMLEERLPPGIGSFSLSRECIDWHKVADKYSGLEITPYLWEKRLSSMWYYGWDCASGCVWNADAVLEVKPFAFFDGRKSQFVRSALQRKPPVVE